MMALLYMCEIGFGTRPGLGRSPAIRSINADLGDKLGASVVGVTSLHAMMIRLGNFDEHAECMPYGGRVGPPERDSPIQLG
jgi:hypothetical protein